MVRCQTLTESQPWLELEVADLSLKQQVVLTAARSPARWNLFVETRCNRYISKWANRETLNETREGLVHTSRPEYSSKTEPVATNLCPLRTKSFIKVRINLEVLFLHPKTVTRRSLLQAFVTPQSVAVTFICLSSHVSRTPAAAELTANIPPNREHAGTRAPLLASCLFSS